MVTFYIESKPARLGLKTDLSPALSKKDDHMDRAPQKLKGFFVEVPTLAERLVDVTAAASRSEAALRDNQVELELLRNLEKNPPGTQKKLIGHFFSRAQSSPSN